MIDPRRDHGSAVAADAARLSVMALEREGGQAQFMHLLETTQHAVERIGEQVGFGSPTSFRDRFKRTTGVSPNTYRRAFR